MLQRANDWVGAKTTQFSLWVGRGVLHALTSGTKFDHSKQPTFNDANPDHPSAAAIQSGGKVLNNVVLPAIAGTVALSAASKKSADVTDIAESSAIGNINWSWKSTPTWGHTFLEHGSGPKMFRALVGKAGQHHDAVGQWLDNEAAAAFLKDFHGTGNQIIDMPEGLGQVILPDGSVQPSYRAQIVFKKDGTFRTAYPLP